MFSSLYLTSFHQGIQWYHQKFKRISVNVPKSHLSLQYNFKKNTFWNIKSVNYCNDNLRTHQLDWSSFRYNRYFWLCSALKWTYFSIPVHVKHWAPLAPPLGEIKIYVHCIFCRKFNFELLLIEVFFWYCWYLWQRSALNEPNFLFQCIKKKIIANLWFPLAPLLVEIKTCAHWVFCWKFNFI